MKQGKIVYTGQSKKGTNLTFRYPAISDTEDMLNYINTLSSERTFITFQGEQLTLEEEQKYLKSQLSKIQKHKAILILVYSDQSLIGISGIQMNDLTEKHIGDFGISVEKSARGEGIGKLLMDCVFKEAKTHLTGLEIVTLRVYSKNYTALKMYEGYGFKEFGRLPKGVKLENSYDDEILMYKTIR